MARVQAVVFDLGAVLLGFDYHLWADKVAPHCRPGLDLLALVAEYDREYDAERGYVEFDHFYRWMQQQAGLVMDLPAFTAAWDDIFWRQEEVISLVPQVRVPQRLLLSNTNPSHVRWLRKQFGDVLALFDQVFLSCEMHLLKPQVEIYQAVTAHTDLSPEQHLFIDDRADNVAGARQAGWQALQFTGCQELREALHRLLA